MTKEDMLYKARVYHDKAVIPQIEEDLKVMVYALIGDQKLEITYNPDGFDEYPSCKHWEKKYCRKKKVYCGRLPSHALVWFGSNRIEIYCKIITSIAGDKTYMPFSVLPRKEISDEGETSSQSI